MKIGNNGKMSKYGWGQSLVVSLTFKNQFLAMAVKNITQGDSNIF